MEITWKPNKPEEGVVGIFSFAVFFSVPLPPKAEAYIEGLTIYRDLCKRGEWAGWKIVIYTDKATLDTSISLGQNNSTKDSINRYRQRLNSLLSDPIFHIATVSWPEFTDASGKLDWRRLICFRYKALADFPAVPVLVRDSDTIFLNANSRLNVERQTPEISAWEQKYLEGLQASGKQFSLATMVKYKRPNLGGGNGFFGGTVGSLGGIPEWQDGSLWQRCLEFISDRANDPVRNVKPPLDVAILVRIIYPALKDRTFLLNYEFTNSSPNYVRGQFTQEQHNMLTGLFKGGSRKKKVKRRTTRKRKSHHRRK